MAQSPSHKFGQIIGTALQDILLPVLEEFCQQRGLYLDKHGDRVGVRSGKKVAWEDKFGNFHDLDFVIEKDGSEKVRGRPVAFIEAAWRRYTKHSRNKAQEIQGAILPIAGTYERDKPFLGAVLAGVFTSGSLNQLRSHGFEVVYLPYETVIEAFEHVGINCRFDEETPDEQFAGCVLQIEELPDAKFKELEQRLLASNKAAFDAFFAALRRKLDRVIDKIVVTPLFGNPSTFTVVDQAFDFIDRFDVSCAAGEFRKFEVTVAFSNGDQIQGIFASKERAKEFLDYVSS